MLQPGGSARGPRPPHNRRPPHRDWRSLLPDLARMVPWPPGEGGGRPTQMEVLQNILGYIQHLQRTLSSVQGGAGDGDTEGGPSAEATQELVPYEEEEELGMAASPWLCLTGPYWEALGWEGGVPLSPPPQRGGLLGLSPPLLASPPPPGPPDEVVRDLFPEVYLSPQAAAVAPREAVANKSPMSPGVAVGTSRGKRGRGQGQGQGGPPRPKKCLNGFIMFCRLNRKSYIRAHPGLASTEATRELAQLWRSLSPDQRRPYCLRAQRFSRLHGRVVRPDRDGDGDDGDGDPDPPQLLLVTRAGPLGGGPLSP